MKRHMMSTYSMIMIRRGVLKSKKTNSSIDADLGISCEKLIYISTPILPSCQGRCRIMKNLNYT